MRTRLTLTRGQWVVPAATCQALEGDAAVGLVLVIAGEEGDASHFLPVQGPVAVGDLVHVRAAHDYKAKTKKSIAWHRSAIVNDLWDWAVLFIGHCLSRHVRMALSLCGMSSVTATPSGTYICAKFKSLCTVSLRIMSIHLSCLILCVMYKFPLYVLIWLMLKSL